MVYDAIKQIVETLGELYQEQPEPGMPQFRADYQSYPIIPESYFPIPQIFQKHRIAAVDGGNQELLGAANFSVQLNRVYYCIFDEQKKCNGTYLPDVIEFISVIRIRIDEGKMNYVFRIIPMDPHHAQFLPDETDMLIAATDAIANPNGFRVQISRLASIARKFAEWKMASLLCEYELTVGDILVMDGTLAAAYRPQEKKYLDQTYSMAELKGIILTGLAKTSRVYTDNGYPLISATAMVAKQTSLEKWFIKVAESTGEYHNASIFVTKLHRNAKTPYRFEVLKKQYDIMTEEERQNIFALLAQNATDIGFPGYPYSLILADQRARVNNIDLPAYKTWISAELSKDPVMFEKVLRDLNAIISHEDLNQLDHQYEA